MNAKQINWPRSRQMLLAAGLVASCLASAAELGSPVAFNAVSPDGLNELRLDVGGKWMEYSIWLCSMVWRTERRETASCADKEFDVKHKRTTRNSIRFITRPPRR